MSQPNVPEPDGLQPGDIDADRAEEADDMGTELARGEEAETDDGAT